MANPTCHLVLAASVVTMLGCGEPSPSAESAEADWAPPTGPIAVAEADSAGIRVVSISGSVDSLPEWSLSERPITEIRSNAEPFIGQVGEVAFLGEQQLLVADNQTAELRVFGADGQVVQVLGGKGDGPGEFQRITQLSVTPDNAVHAYDLVHSRISSFDQRGSLIATIPMPRGFAGPRTYVEDAWALDSDRFLRVGKRNPEETGDPTGPVRLLVRDGVIDVTSSEGTSLASPIEIGGGSLIIGERLVGPGPVSNRPFVAANSNRVLSGSGRTYELLLRDTDLRPLMVIRWTGWAQPMTSSLAGALQGRMKASVESLRSLDPPVPPPVIEGELRIVDINFRPEVLPDTLPALGFAMLDEDGRIWVARYQPPDDGGVARSGPESDWRQEDVWHLLDPDGKPVARVRLPPQTRLLAVRRDRVVVVTRDDLDAQTIRVLALNQTPTQTTTAGVGR
jgi:hypothetical protein